jgi:hypothetical protein
MFFTEFANFLELNSSTTGKLILVGDFNFHWDCYDNHDTQQIRELIDSVNLIQHVSEPTHTSGHILDWVMSRAEDNIVCNVDVSVPISDHHCVNASVKLNRPPLPQKSVSFRQYRKIDMELFTSDLMKTDLILKPSDTLDDLIRQYDSTLSELIEKHAPLMTKTITVRPITPWYSVKVRELKAVRRKCEKRWRESRPSVHLEAYKEARNAVNTEIDVAKRSYYNSKIKDCGNDQRALFRVINELLHSKDKHPLPQHTDLTDLLTNFSDFFQQKIRLIRDKLDKQAALTNSSTVLTSVLSADTTASAYSFASFEKLGCEDEKQIVMASPTKSCALDPIPTWLLKDILDFLTPTITNIVNSSLLDGYFPLSMKKALVLPLLKKATLDKEIFKNYRPVSNLSFLSKVIERASLRQLSYHMDTNDLHTPCQSAYRPFHSTETALLKIENDILNALDSSKGILLILLDLSAAFDTVDHGIFLSRLSSRIGVTGTALQWFKSYLSDRFQIIHFDGVSSKSCKLIYGVPQGSVDGPFDFIIYTGPIHDIAAAHGLQIHMYADDTQIYIEFDLNPFSASQAKCKLEACVDDIRAWMRQNKLQLNEDKTELVVITPSRQSGKVQIESVKVGTSDVLPSESARNLGATFDKNMTLQPHVSSLVRSCNWQLRRIGQLRKYLTTEAAEKIIHAFISSRLDNGNSLLFGLPDYQINRLQRIHNTAARILTLTNKYSHITPILESLHWLPIQYRIMFKILTLTYRCLNGSAPSYLSQLLSPYNPPRSLRSSDQLLLTIPKTKTKTYGDRAFQNAAPKLWNGLPLSIRQATTLTSFKKQLKCYFFEESFKRT